MPRKRENGLGSFGFKDASKKDLHKGKFGAAGNYPSDRRYGTKVTRSAIEQYDLDSDWIKWRKGYEYYNQAAWYIVEDYDPKTESYARARLPSMLYQGTEAECPVEFEGYKFATKNADSNLHYVMKRTVLDEDYDIGSITEIRNDFYYDFDYKNKEYLFFKRNHQILTKLKPGPKINAIYEMIGDRLTDGETEATISFVLDKNLRPALYLGKQYSFEGNTLPSDSTIELELDLDQITFTDPAVEETWTWDKIQNEVIYVPDMFVKRTLEELDSYQFVEARDYFAIETTYTSENDTQVLALDITNNLLPPTLFDIGQLGSIFSGVGKYTINGAYLFKKSVYQSYWGDQYLTANAVEKTIEEVSFSVLPFKIIGYRLTDKNTVILQSVPFKTEIKMYSDVTDGFLALDDRSFTKTVVDNYENKDGTTRYYHRDYLPVYKDGKAQPLQGREILRYEKAPIWQRLETEVDPWSDEVYANNQRLRPANLFGCSCPNYSKSILRAPEATQPDNIRKQNRQRRYPLPSVMSTFDYEGIGINDVSGAAETWETRDDRMQFRMCKHTVAARFIEYIKTKEPSAYQSIESRLKFEEKLQNDITEVAEEFRNSYERGGISSLEILFAMGKILNLDAIAMANTIFLSFDQSAGIAAFESERRQTERLIL